MSAEATAHQTLLHTDVALRDCLCVQKEMYVTWIDVIEAAMCARVCAHYISM